MKNTLKTRFIGCITAGVFALTLGACTSLSDVELEGPGGQTGGAATAENGDASSGAGGEGTMANVDEELLGAWTSDENGTPTLEFAESGAVTGTDGCNRIVSTYEVDEPGHARIAAFAITQMACTGVNQWLGAASQVERDGDVLTVFNNKGEEIGQLQRAS